MNKAAYEIHIRPLSAEDGGGFLAEVPELPAACRTARRRRRRSKMCSMRFDAGPSLQAKWGGSSVTGTYLSPTWHLPLMPAGRLRTQRYVSPILLSLALSGATNYSPGFRGLWKLVL